MSEASLDEELSEGPCADMRDSASKGSVRRMVRRGPLDRERQSDGGEEEGRGGEEQEVEVVEEWEEEEQELDTRAKPTPTCSMVIARWCSRGKST